MLRAMHARSARLKGYAVELEEQSIVMSRNITFRSSGKGSVIDVEE
jgi:hypothetical protein